MTHPPQQSIPAPIFLRDDKRSPLPLFVTRALLSEEISISEFASDETLPKEAP